MPDNEFTFKEQLILIPLVGFFILAAIACAIGYHFFEADSFADYGYMAGIAAILTAMLGHTVLGLLQRLFNFKL